MFFDSGLAVNSERYIDRCLPKVNGFITNKHQGLNVVLWPDLASSHYAWKTLDAMNTLQIPHVSKAENPPNVPQLRPIEDFWASLERRVYANNFRPNNVKNLINKIKCELHKMPTSMFTRAMEKIPQNFRKAPQIEPNFFFASTIYTHIHIKKWTIKINSVLNKIWYFKFCPDFIPHTLYLHKVLQLKIQWKALKFKRT